MMKCAKCGEDAQFFTELYDPYMRWTQTIWLCKTHQVQANNAFRKAVMG